MEAKTTVRSTVIDVALCDTGVEDDDVLTALCDEHVGATQRAIKNRDPLLDWPEYKEATL